MVYQSTPSVSTVCLMRCHPNFAQACLILYWSPLLTLNWVCLDLRNVAYMYCNYWKYVLYIKWKPTCTCVLPKVKPPHSLNAPPPTHTHRPDGPLCGHRCSNLVWQLSSGKWRLCLVSIHTVSSELMYWLTVYVIENVIKNMYMSIKYFSKLPLWLLSCAYNQKQWPTSSLCTKI